MRWRKVLSPLGLPGRAVICTRANRRSVRGAALSLQAAVLRLLQRSLFLLTLHHLSPSFLSIWLCLASSLRCLYSACLDCSFLFVCLQEVFPFDCQTKCTDSWWNSTSLQKKKGSSTFLLCSELQVKCHLEEAFQLHSTYRTSIFHPTCASLLSSPRNCSPLHHHGGSSNPSNAPWWDEEWEEKTSLGVYSEEVQVHLSFALPGF